MASLAPPYFVAQGILPFVFEAMPTPADLTARAGLTLVSETMLAVGLDEMVAETLRLRVRDRGYSEFDKLYAVVLVQAAGGECVQDVRVLAADRGLTRLLGRAWPAPDTLHDFWRRFTTRRRWRSAPRSGRESPPSRPRCRRWGKSIMLW